MPKTAFSALQSGLGSVPLHHELMSQEMCHQMHAGAEMRPYMHREDMVSLPRMHPQALPHSSLRGGPYHPSMMPMHGMHAADHAVHTPMAHMHAHHHPYSSGMQVPSHMYLYDTRAVAAFENFDRNADNERGYSKRRHEYYEMTAQHPRKPLQERDFPRPQQHQPRSPSKSTSPAAPGPVGVEESDEMAASILNQIHAAPTTGQVDMDINGLALECLKTRVQLWNKHTDMFRKLDNTQHKGLSELMAADRPLYERCNSFMHSMELKADGAAGTHTRSPERNTAHAKSAPATSPSGDDFSPEPASAYCNGCVVMIRRDSRVATVIREKAGGWRVVLFEDGSTGRFRPSDLQKIKDPEGIEPREGDTEHKHNHSNPFQDCVGLTVVIRKSGRAGTIIGEKAGGWRIVQYDDGSTGTHRPSDMDILPPGKDLADCGLVQVSSPHDHGADADADDVSSSNDSSGHDDSERDQQPFDEYRRPMERFTTIPETKPPLAGAPPLSIKATDVAVVQPSAVAVTPLSSVAESGPEPSPTTSIPLNELVIVKRTGKKGLVVSEKAGGWRVIEFEDGSKTTCRPSDLLVCEQYSSALAAAAAASLTAAPTSKSAGFQFGVESRGFEKLFSQLPAHLDTVVESTAANVCTKRKLSETFDELEPTPTAMDIRVPGPQGTTPSCEPIEMTGGKPNIVTPRAVHECPTSPFKKEKLATPTEEAPVAIPLQT